MSLRENDLAVRPTGRARMSAAERDAMQREIVRFGAFFDAYSDLVELICDAAQAGIEPWMEEKYASYRLAFAEICVRSDFGAQRRLRLALPPDQPGRASEHRRRPAHRLPDAHRRRRDALAGRPHRSPLPRRPARRLTRLDAPAGFGRRSPASSGAHREGPGRRARRSGPSETRSLYSPGSAHRRPGACCSDRRWCLPGPPSERASP